MRFANSILFLFLTLSLHANDKVLEVHPSGETQFEYEAGDADDPCIWIHPTNPDQSVIIGTDKDHGISVFDLSGTEIHHRPDGELNNVDIRYNFPLGKKTVDILTAGNRTTNTLMVYSIDPLSRQLSEISAHPIQSNVELYGSCMYHSRQTNQYYAFLNSKDGEVEQWELIDNGSGEVEAKLVRTFDVGTQTEGCVADDELGYFYIGEEEHAIWKYRADPQDGDLRTLVDQAGEHFTIDVEGLSIYYGPNGTGYLIASSQGDSTYIVYEREGVNNFIMKFAITDGNGITGTSDTDGLDVTNINLGSLYPHGLFIAHDGPNKNFKLVRWEEITKLINPPLLINTAWNPRFSYDNKE